MRSLKTPALAIAALALASAATPSFAGSPYYDAMGNPMSADQADMMRDGMMNPTMGGQPRAAGHFTCAPGERQTRLQRRACSSTKTMN